MDQEIAVDVKNVSKIFNPDSDSPVTALDNVSVAIRNNEFFTLLGPSGCGKTTILRLIAGFEHPTEGQILLNNEDISYLHPNNRPVNMVFQNYALYPHMTVFNNMAYGLKLKNYSKAEIKTRVNQAAKLLQLEGLLKRKPRQLSGGQRQRVAMGRCIVREPKVFLFDEPLSNLDAKLRVQMRLELRSLHERLKVTSIYVTHDQVEAMTLGDRLIVINKGYAEQIGSPLDLYEKPATRFVAGFIGSPAMNFLNATISRDGTRAELPGGILLPLKNDGLESYKDKVVVIGIRPEHFSISQSDGHMPMIIDHAEILGADTMVYGHLATTDAPITVRLPDIHHFDRQTQLALSVSQDKIHLFERESGRRIGA